MMASYKIEFEDQGQDLLRIECDAATGLITDCGPFHQRLYVGQGFKIKTDDLTKYRYVKWIDTDGKERTFRWPMVKLSLGRKVLCKVEATA
jgi:hypothetical protein